VQFAQHLRGNCCSGGGSAPGSDRGLRRSARQDHPPRATARTGIFPQSRDLVGRQLRTQ